MGRTPHIQPGANPTTVYLTKAQKVAFRKFQAKRMEEIGREPGLTEVFLEGFRLVLEKEGWTPTELGTIFPKLEARGAKISVFPKRRKSRSTL